LSEQTLDLKGSLRLIRRFWRTVAVLVLVGLVAGGAYEQLRPPEYHATSLVLLPTGSASATGSGATAANALTTDGRIATSASVLGPAGQEVDRSLTVNQLQQRVTTSSAATGVLSITATGTTAAQAVALANAVANNLVSFVTSAGSVTDTGILTGLQAQENELNSQIADVNKELAAANSRLATDGVNTTAGQQDAALVGKLTSEQSSLTLQLNSVKSQIATTKLGQVSANQGTRVIQHATAASGPKVTTLVTTVLLGGIAGLLLGCLYVLARHRKDPRLWTRDEVAESLGSPVVLSLSAPSKDSPSNWVALFQGYQPSSAEQWNIRKALRELGLVDGASSVAVLSLAGDVAGTAQAAEVAVGAADSGLDTLFTVIADEHAMAGLQAACVQFGADRPRQGLELKIGTPPQRDVMPDLTVTAAVVDAERPALPDFLRPGTTTVISVSAGHASAEQLARLAILAADRGQPVRGIFVANPGADDQTVGRYPDSSSRTSLVLHRRTLAAKSGVASGQSR
jgi:capsular polysaccharide biosynthesis protein